MCCFPLTVQCTPVYLHAGKHMGLTRSVATPCLAQPHRLRTGCWMLLCHWQVFASLPCSAATSTSQEGSAAGPGVRLWAAHLALQLLVSGCPGCCPGCGLGAGGGGMLARLCWKTSPGCQPGTVGGSDLSGGVPAHIFLSQIRAEACQEIHSEPAMLLLSVPTPRALLALLPPTLSLGLPSSSPQLHVRLLVPQLQPQLPTALPWAHLQDRR